jgi:hypothetical protein
MTDIVRDCPCCGSAREFSQIHIGSGRCPDSGDGCCPEWVCSVCGTALLVAVPVSRSAAWRLDRVA